jgi:hypothetical protein
VQRQERVYRASERVLDLLHVEPSRLLVTPHARPWTGPTSLSPSSPIGQSDARCTAGQAWSWRCVRAWWWKRLPIHVFRGEVVTPVASAFVDAWSRNSHAQEDSVIAARRLPCVCVSADE